MPSLQKMLVPMELPHEEEIITSEHEQFPLEIRKELEAKLVESARTLIDL